MSTHVSTGGNGHGQSSFDTPLPLLVENETEVTRLLLLHRYLSLQVGAVPPSLNLSKVCRVLDVGCGVGGWVFEMAWKYPEMQVIGIDASDYFIAAARELADGRLLFNTEFLVRNMHRLGENAPVAFGSFDLVHMGYLAGNVLPEQFPALLQRLAGLCRTGGLLCWDEAEFPMTNSLAFEQFSELVLRGLQVAGRSFVPTTRVLGITPMMGQWLRKAGYRQTIDHAHAIDVSTGTPIHASFCRQMWVFAHQIRPFLLSTGVTTGTAFEGLFTRLQQELQEETFCGLCFVRTIVGEYHHT
jgi:SAM-dependent methyltransferase